MKAVSIQEAQMLLRLPLLFILLVPIFVVGTQMASDKKPMPPSPKDLVGVWVGFDSDQLTFTRLDLR